MVSQREDGQSHRASALGVAQDPELRVLAQYVADRCLGLFEIAAVCVTIADLDDRPPMVISAGPQLEQMPQAAYERAPCVDVLATGRPLVVCALDEQRERWPEFATDAVSVGLRKAYAFPMYGMGGTVGSLTLFAGSKARLAPPERRAAQTITDIAAAGVLQYRVGVAATRRAAQLQHALDNRVVIEQAKGILMARWRVPPQRAFEAIRTYARSNRLRVVDVAQRLIDGTAGRRASPGELP